MDFVNRTEELGALERWWRRRSARLAVTGPLPDDALAVVAADIFA